MLYLSMDIETSTLVPSPDHILGVAMVVEDTEKDIPLLELPKFVCGVRHKEVKGQPYALAMNGWLIDMIAGYTKQPAKYPVYNAVTEIQEVYHGFDGVYSIDTWMWEAHKFLVQHFGHGRITVAGKNVGSFDLQFMPKLIRQKFRHRCIDVGSVLIDWKAPTVLSLDELLLAKSMGKTVTHDMYDDALDVISLLRTSYPKK